MQTIFFSHANGFPARTYDYFLRKLHPFAVDYVPVLGDHTPAPLRHWRSLTHELINAIESRHSAPVIGLGHSLGAVLTLWAAASRPDLFSRVILMDPPLFVPTKRWLLAGITALGLAPWLNPVAQKARNRRQHFTSLAEAEAYWRPKPLFRDFHPQCFQDYVAHALQPDQDGFSLRFPAEREYRLFLCAPLRIGPQPPVPSHFVHSTAGKVLRPADLAWLKKHFPSMTFVPAKGGHMFPLEQPEATAAMIHHHLGAGPFVPKCE